MKGPEEVVRLLRSNLGPELAGWVDVQGLVGEEDETSIVGDVGRTGLGANGVLLNLTIAGGNEEEEEGGEEKRDQDHVDKKKMADD